MSSPSQWELPFAVLSPQNHLLSCLLSAPSPRPPPAPVLVLCHGHAASKRAPFISSLACLLSSLLDPTYAIARLDFTGNGASEGPFLYSNYHDEAADICVVVRHLHNEGYQVRAVVGHSKGATSALLFMAQHDEFFIPRLVCLAGRWKMNRGLVERFGKEAMERMENGESHRVKSRRWDGEGKLVPFEYEVTAEHVRERMFTDVVGAVKQLREEVRVLIVHGECDSIIPVEDSSETSDEMAKRGIAVASQIVKGGGHTFEGQEKEVAEAISDFCKENDG
eukprot:GFKZ01009320.1.p1 GENE.GFKZ01009320.1~~GFKZ01009320.1.p1  ORF type:complete len:279 (+),score=42.26 GFKZ01009320.1:495-1331(+)